MTRRMWLQVATRLGLIAVLAGALAHTVGNVIDADTAHRSEHVWGLPACETEDDTDCYWDADAAGNGEGRSFVAVGDVVHYVSGGDR